MKIKDLISTNNNYDWYRDDAVCVLAEFAAKGCYEHWGKTYFVNKLNTGNRHEQLETEIVDLDTMVDEQVDKLFDFVMA